jgi:hypothetical protein
MLWDKSAASGERRDQLERQIRRYPKDRFLPFTPREIARETSSG